MRLISFLLFALGCLFLVAHCTLQRERPRTPRYPVSSGPWAVNGIALGAGEDECRRLLGDDAEELVSRRGARSLTWRRLHEVCITFDAAGRARDVLGDLLTDTAGNVVLPRGATLEDARDVLPQAKEREHTRPTGHGVISLSRIYVGSTLEWDDGAGSYMVGVGPDESLTYARVVAAE